MGGVFPAITETSVGIPPSGPILIVNPGSREPVNRPRQALSRGRSSHGDAAWYRGPRRDCQGRTAL